MIEITCSCEKKTHKAPMEMCEISSGAIYKIPKILKGYKKVYIVADSNTYKAAGKYVEDILKENDMLYNTFVFDDQLVLPNAQSIGKVLLNFQPLDAKPNIFEYCPMPDFILAVGSGSLNDICRVVSYRIGLPYGIVATAPSMDGYASAGSPILHDGTKSTIQGTTPKYIIADIDVLKEAPYDMMLAGIGDMFGKYTGMLDWELARDYTGEYFCDKISADVIEATNKCLANGYNIADRNPECIKNIMDGFLVTGLGMAFIGNSRPASGSEHIIAHAWELFDVEAANAPHLHGLEVCEATRLVAIMYKMLHKETEDAHLKQLIEKYIPYFNAVEEFCKKMKVPPTVVKRETILAGIKRALIMRDRYTILFYLRDIGKFDEYAEKATDELLKLI
ncbi:MAG: sn-glycerol-1-phosphate dehydrogenase [Clostridia bacterium]|nr:sn-glycerol-1-phosphate dehydrogenase [Clostridia bacterium]